MVCDSAEMLCRMSLKWHRGYIRRSTQETNIERAKEVSLQILGELRQRPNQMLQMHLSRWCADYLRLNI